MDKYAFATNQKYDVISKAFFRERFVRIFPIPPRFQRLRRASRARNAFVHVGDYFGATEGVSLMWTLPTGGQDSRKVWPETAVGKLDCSPMPTVSFARLERARAAVQIVKRPCKSAGDSHRS
eukprot:gene15846-biopygen8199